MHAICRLPVGQVGLLSLMQNELIGLQSLPCICAVGCAWLLLVPESTRGLAAYCSSVWGKGVDTDIHAGVLQLGRP